MSVRATFVCALLLMGSRLAAATEDAAHGFSFTAPEGYAAAPMGTDAATLHSFARGATGGGSWGVFVISSLGGTIGQESKLHPEIVEQAAREAGADSGIVSAHFEYRKVKWGAFDLELVVSQASGNGQQLVSLATQVPLERGAVQVQFVGPAAEEGRLSSDLRALLDSLHGKSNWLSEADRDRQLGERVGMGVGLVFGGCVLPGAALLVVWLVVRKRREAKRTSGG
jgi:hypothetical protein